MSGSARSRTEAIAVANSYIEGGLLAHDPNAPRLAPTCFRHENGWDTGTMQVTRDHFRHMTMCVGVRNVRWMVEEPFVVARFELLLSEDFGGSKPVAEVFRLGAAGIEEIAAVFPLARWTDNARGPASEAARQIHPAQPRSGPEAAAVTVGERLLAGVVSDEADLLPLGDDVTLTENGRLVARGLDATHGHLRQGTWSSVRAVRVQQWVAEGSEAWSRMELATEGAGLLACSVYIRVYDSLVREIDVNYGAGPSAEAVSAWRACRGAEPGS